MWELEIPNTEMSDPKQSTFKMTNMQTKDSICGNPFHVEINVLHGWWHNSNHNQIYF